MCHDPEKKTELKHQARVVYWCKENGIKICGTAQSTFTNSWKAIADNQTAGVVRGLPDLILVIPARYRKNNMGKVVHIEMKKPDGGVTSKEQKEWIEALDNAEGVNAKVCHGSIDAVEYIKTFLELIPPIDTRPIHEQEWFKNQ